MPVCETQKIFFLMNQWELVFEETWKKDAENSKLALFLAIGAFAKFPKVLECVDSQIVSIAPSYFQTVFSDRLDRFRNNISSNVGSWC